MKNYKYSVKKNLSIDAVGVAVEAVGSTKCLTRLSCSCHNGGSFCPSQMVDCSRASQMIFGFCGACTQS